MSKSEFERNLNALLSPPEDARRIRAFTEYESFSEFVECLKAKLKATGEKEFVVFGHTHKPFIDVEKRVANTGCWVDGTLPSNTYFEFERWPPRLIEFKGKELKATAISLLKF